MCWWWLCEMGAALSQPPAQSGGKKKPEGPSGASSSLGTLRRRIAAAAKRTHRSDRAGVSRGFLRWVVSGWGRGEVCRLHGLYAGLDHLHHLAHVAELARPPADTLHQDLQRHTYLCDVELVCVGGCVRAHRAVLVARSRYFRDLLCGNHQTRIVLPSNMSYRTIVAAMNLIYERDMTNRSEEAGSQNDLDIINTDTLSPSVRVQLGLSSRPLTHDLAYLYHSGESCDVNIEFGSEGSPVKSLHKVHAAILAARSRLFRKVLSRPLEARPVVVDSEVIPERFAPTLLHAAYTDTIDLSLIKKLPVQGNASNNTNTTSWPGLKSNKNSSKVTSAMLEDVFQLYQIARFIEMAIAVQGCEDLLVSWLSGDTLNQILSWACEPHGSHWVYRQCRRYIREEFPRVSLHIPSGEILSALRDLGVPHCETSLLRCVVQRAERAHDGSSGKCSPSEVREFLSPLLPHLRLHHISPDNETLQQALRRGYIPRGCYNPDLVRSPASWLDLAHPPRLYQPYIDELKTILDELGIPDIELSHMRPPQITTIPENIYNTCVGWGGWCGERWRRVVALSARTRHTPALHVYPTLYYTQLCLRAVRERSLPDSCADVLLSHIDTQPQIDVNQSTSRSESVASNSNRNSVTHADVISTSGRRRELPALVAEGQHRSCMGLSLCVPDVAMAPNGNTHLLPHTHYTTYEVPMPRLQLDLGDGAPHTPQRGSRAGRAALHRPNRDSSQQWSDGTSVAEDRVLFPHAHTARRCVSASSTAARPHTLSRVNSAERNLSDAPAQNKQPSRPHSSRFDPSYSASTSSSRGPSPNYT